MSLWHLKTGFFCLKMDLIKNQSDIFDEVLLSWVKVSKKRFH